MSEGAWLWVDGGLAPAAGPHLSARDRGFTLGDGLFETMRARAGRILHLDRHLARLRAGAALLELILPWSDDDLVTAAGATLAANGLAAAAVRLTVSRGRPRGRGLLPEPAALPALVIDAQPFAGYPAELYARGMRAVTSGIRRNEHSPLARAKTLSYLDNVLARAEAARAGADEALLRNTAGGLACASAANLFLVSGGQAATPPVAAGALPGIMRGRLLEEVAAAAGLAAVERPLTPDELLTADEAFLTSSLLGVMPLTAVDGRPVGAGRPGAATRRLAAALAAVDRAAAG